MTYESKITFEPKNSRQGQVKGEGEEDFETFSPHSPAKCQTT